MKNRVALFKIHCFYQLFLSVAVIVLTCTLLVIENKQYGSFGTSPFGVFSLFTLIVLYVISLLLPIAIGLSRKLDKFAIHHILMIILASGMIIYGYYLGLIPAVALIKIPDVFLFLSFLRGDNTSPIINTCYIATRGFVFAIPLFVLFCIHGFSYHSWGNILGVTLIGLTNFIYGTHDLYVFCNKNIKRQ